MSGNQVAGSTRKKQDVGTPPEFLAAVVKRWGALTWDLAATQGNSVALGNYFSPEQDSLAHDWLGLGQRLWLNPPFGKIPAFANRCRQWTRRNDNGDGALLFLLTPAAVDSNWYRDYVHDLARVFFLSPRIRFVGEKDPFPKPLMLSVFGLDAGFEFWKWKPLPTRAQRIEARVLRYLAKDSQSTKALRSKCSDCYDADEVDAVLLSLVNVGQKVHVANGQWYLTKKGQQHERQQEAV